MSIARHTSDEDGEVDCDKFLASGLVKYITFVVMMEKDILMFVT